MPHDMTSRGIAGFRLVVGDLLRAPAFYRAIGFDVCAAVPIPATEMQLLGLSGSGSRIAMSLGGSQVDLDCFDQTGQEYPRDAVACDLIFQHLALVTDDAKTAWRRARDAGATPISRECPVTLPESTGGATAVKFRDPDGHPLEFLQFPPGANPSWQGAGIMGIDHSAISVGNIAASRHFYARLGMREAVASINQGPTQTALDGLDGVRVEVAPMAFAEKTLHVELLGYRNPLGRTHRLMAANDIAATRIVWLSDSEALVRDPDGHLHQFNR